MAEFFEALKTSFNDTFGDTINLGSTSILTLNIIVWSLFIGFLIGIGATIYNKVILGALTRSIIDRQIFNEDAALSLEQLGHANPFVKFALRRGGTFRRIVRMCGDSADGDSSLSVSRGKFFIPEENIPRAEKIYGNLGVSIPSILLSVLAFLVVTLLALIVVPDLIQLVVNLMSEVNV